MAILSPIGEVKWDSLTQTKMSPKNWASSAYLDRSENQQSIADRSFLRFAERFLHHLCIVYVWWWPCQLLCARLLQAEHVLKIGSDELLSGSFQLMHCLSFAQWLFAPSSISTSVSKHSWVSCFWLLCIILCKHTIRYMFVVLLALLCHKMTNSHS